MDFLKSLRLCFTIVMICYFELSTVIFIQLLNNMFLNHSRSINVIKSVHGRICKKKKKN